MDGVLVKQNNKSIKMSIFLQEGRANELRSHYKELCSKPNSQMVGRTFDARHLEKFLQTGYGERTAYFAPVHDLHAVTDNHKLRSSLSALAIQSNVRPDPCFLNVPRPLRKDANHSCTLKPFELVYPKTFNPAAKEATNFYRHELREVAKLKDKYSPAKLLLNQEDIGMKSHKERRREIEEVKNNMQNYAEFKRAKELAERRSKQVKSGWRNGVVGVDCVLNPETFFFRERQEKMVERESERRDINEANRHCMLLATCRSDEVQRNKFGHRSLQSVVCHAPPRRCLSLLTDRNHKDKARVVDEDDIEAAVCQYSQRLVRAPRHRAFQGPGHQNQS